MIQRRHKPYAPYIYHESSNNGCPIGSVSNKYTASKKSRFCACISSRITTVIQITSDHQINYNCFNEPFAVSTCKDLYWDMHGLIFETSIWLLAGSTRFLSALAPGRPKPTPRANDSDERVHWSELVDSIETEISIEQNSYFTLRRDD